MRRFLPLLLIAGFVFADDAEAERLKLARVAMEAKLKLGDLLRQKGELDAALEAYRDAIRIHDGLKRAPAGRPAGKRTPARDRAYTRADVEKAVALGLHWLARHQSEDGRWDCDGFMRRDPADDKCDGPGNARYDVGVTGLSVLAMLRDRETYAEQIRLGLKFLIERLDDTGCFGTRASAHFVYNTVIATHAMSEAYRLTRNKDYGRFAQQGIDFLQKARNPYLAWRYEPRGGENDTSVTTLCVMALKAGKFADLDVDADAFEGARQWIDKMTDPEFGQVGYNMPGGPVARPQALVDKFPAHRSHSMTAAGILTRIMLGEDPRKSGIIQKGVTLCLREQPDWTVRRGTIDMYYWYFGTRALFEVGGAAWRDWPSNLWNQLLFNQRTRGASAGSWDPVGPWGPDGGRVYATAINLLSLQETLREGHTRIFGARN